MSSSSPFLIDLYPQGTVQHTVINDRTLMARFAPPAQETTSEHLPRLRVAFASAHLHVQTHHPAEISFCLWKCFAAQTYLLTAVE